MVDRQDHDPTRATGAEREAPIAPTRPPRSTSAVPATARERILDAALGELSLHGYAAASLERIAATARVTKPMIHYYFASKAGLHHAVLERARQVLNETLAEAGAAVGAHAQISAVAQASRAGAETLAILGARTADHPGVISPLVGALENALAPILAAGAARGEIEACEPRVAALVLAAALHPLDTARSRQLAEILWRALRHASV